MNAKFQERIQEEMFLRGSGFSTMSNHGNEANHANHESSTLEKDLARCKRNTTLAQEICHKVPNDLRPKFMRRRLSRVFGHDIADAVTFSCPEATCDLANEAYIKNDEMVFSVFILIILSSFLWSVYVNLASKFCSFRRGCCGLKRSKGDGYIGIPAKSRGMEEWDQDANRKLHHQYDGDNEPAEENCSCALM